MVLPNPLKAPNRDRGRVRRPAAGLAALLAQRRTAPLPAAGDRVVRAPARDADGPLRTGRRRRRAADRGAGAPLAGLPVEVIESFAAGAGAPQRTTTVRTGGRRQLPRPPGTGPEPPGRGRLRRHRTPDPASGGEPVRACAVRAASACARPRPRRRSAARRSSSAAASATSARRSPPAAGRSSSSSASPARAWTEFRTVQTDAHGRFRYPYRFSDDDSRGVRFQFRAFVPAQDDWPYEPAPRGRSPSRAAEFVRAECSGPSDATRKGPACWLHAGLCEVAQRAGAVRCLAERGELVGDLIDEPWAREVCSSIALRTRCSTSLRLRFSVVSTVRWRLRASRSTRLRVLRASVVALRRAVVPRRSVRFRVLRSSVR